MKLKSAVKAFTMGSCFPQLVVVYLFLKSLNLSFMLEFQSDVIYDATSANMFHLFTAVEVLMKRTFFVFSLFLFLLMGSQGYSMFFLELLMEQMCWVC